MGTRDCSHTALFFVPWLCEDTGLFSHSPVLCLLVMWGHGTVLTQSCSLSSGYVRTRDCSHTAPFFVFWLCGDTGLFSHSPVLCFLVMWGHGTVLTQPCSLSSGYVRTRDCSHTALLFVFWLCEDTGLFSHSPVLCLLVMWGHGTVLTQPCSLSSGYVRTRDCSHIALFFVFWSGEVAKRKR